MDCLFLFGGAGMFHVQALLDRILNGDAKDLKKIFLIEPISEIREDSLFLEKFHSLVEKFSEIHIQLTFFDLSLDSPSDELDSNKNDLDSSKKELDSNRKEFDSERLNTVVKQIQFQIQNAIQNNSGNYAEIFFHPFYRRHFPDICKLMNEAFSNTKQKPLSPQTHFPLNTNLQIPSHTEHSADSQIPPHSHNINESTISHFARTWTSHFLRNKLELSSLRLLTPNKKSIEFPLVFAGASPLLESQLDWIIRNRSRMFLLSSDTALGFLIEKNTMPDAVISVDSGRGTFFHFSKNLPISIPIFTWLGGNRILFGKRMNTYLFLTNYPLDQLLAEVCQIPDSFILSNPSRNVAGMAIAIARFLKYKTIILTGFELKSGIAKTHVQATGYESYAMPLVHRKKKIDSFYPRKMYSSQFTQKNLHSFQAILETEGIDCKILSDSSLDLTCPELKNSQEINFLEIPSTVSLYLDRIIPQELPGIVASVVSKYQQIGLE